MNRMEGSQPVAHSAIGHERARCDTRVDSFNKMTATESGAVRFAHLSVSIAIDPVHPVCMGVELHSNGHIFDVKAWTVEKHINFGKVALYVGKNIINFAKEKINDTIINFATYFTSSGDTAKNERTLRQSQLATQFSDDILTMLHMVTDIRNIQGSEADWQEHMEYVKNGKRNPRWPRNALLDQFTKKAHECEALQDKLSTLATKKLDRLKQSEFEKMSIMQHELVRKTADLYRETLDNLKAMTGFSTEEILDQAYTVKREFYTEASMKKPESEWELCEMTVAEGNGFPDRNKLEAYLDGDITTLVPDVVTKVIDNNSEDESLAHTTDSLLEEIMDNQLQCAGIEFSPLQVTVDLSDIKPVSRQHSLGSISTDSGLGDSDVPESDSEDEKDLFQ